jgi:enoyl-CoA hydratase
MTDSVLLIDKSEGIATLTLNRPESMNALSHELRTTFTQTFTDLSRDPDIGVVILTGAGRAFCAGLDLRELSAMGMSTQDSVVGGPTDVVRAMEAFDRPIIGAINGFAITGGFEIALACDILIASPAARFADTHARVGVMPGWGLSQKLSRAIGLYRAKELSLTGNYLSAEQAAEWGLVNRVVASEELLSTCRALAKDILSCVPEMVRSMKRVIDQGYAASLADGLQVEHEAWAEHARTVTPDAIAARRSGIQQRGRTQAS